MNTRTISVVLLLALFALMSCKDIGKNDKQSLPSYFSKIDRSGKVTPGVSLLATDSFYLLTRQAYKAIRNKDSLLLRSMLKEMTTSIDSVKDPTLLGIYHHQSSALYGRQDSLRKLELAKAAEYYSKVDGFASDKVKAFYDYAHSVYVQYGSLDTSIYYASQIVPFIPKDSFVLQCQVNRLLSKCHYYNMEFSKSIDFGSTLVDLYSQDTLENLFAYAEANMDLGTTYYDIGEYEAAIEKKELAYKLVNRIPERKENAFEFLSNLILILINGNELERAGEYLLELEALANDPTDHYKQYGLNRLQGIKSFNEQNFGSAVQLFQEAKRNCYLLSDDYKPYKLEIGTLLLMSLSEVSDYKTANQVLDDVKAIAPIPDVGPDLFSDQVFMDLAIADAEIKIKLGIDKKDTKSIRAGLSTLEEIEDGLELHTLGMDNDNLLYIYDLYYELSDLKLRGLFELGILKNQDSYFKEAFVDYERQKSKSLYQDKLSLQNADESLELNALISREKWLMELSKTEEKYIQERNLLLDSIESFYPEYYGLYYSNDFDLIQSLQSWCDKNNQTIVEYFYGYQNSFCFVITSDQISMKRLDPSAISLAEDYGIITDLSMVDSFAILNKQLSDILITPILDELKTEKLMIIPDGYFDLISFEGLLHSQKNEYLIHDFDITYSFSGKSLLLEKRSALDPKKAKITAFSYSDRNTVKSQEVQAYPELLGAYNEVLTIAHLFGKQAQIFAGERASKKIFLEEGFDGQIIHLGTHGIGNSTLLKDNKIIFRGPEEENTLYPYELKSIDSEVELVFLSACETGLGRVMMHNGAISMARSFAGTGINNLVSSSWSISDRVTQKIVEDFYASYLENGDISQSLNSAKRNFLLDPSNAGKSHPYYWAALTHHQY